MAPYLGVNGWGWDFGGLKWGGLASASEAGSSCQRLWWDDTSIFLTVDSKLRSIHFHLAFNTTLMFRGKSSFY